MEKDGSFFIEEEIRLLQEENGRLRQQLGARRYKMADRIVDTIYRLMPYRTKKIAEDAGAKSPTTEKRKFTRGRVDIINHTFYDWDGKVLYKGGAERYVYDLALLLQRLGYQPRILQGANEGFEKVYRKVPVVGVKAGGIKPWDHRGLSTIYNDVCREAEFIIASPNELACNIKGIPCIGINHGISFDSVWTSAYSTMSREYETHINSIESSAYCVCVDTNYINWMRTRDYGLSQKLIYIPNYYNKSSLKKLGQKQPRQDDRLVFVYPRRLYAPRGYDITIQAFRKVLSKYPNVELRFVGQFDSEKVQKEFEQFSSEFPENVKHLEYKMENAYRAYEDADVILVPTRYSEGTSLSCIEGQAFGLPVIATNVGGLPNLVIDHYNGLLISPTAEALEKAVLELIKNPKLREEMGKRALDVARTFEQKAWEKRWKTVISDLKRELKG